MRKAILGIAAAGSVFALTAAGASTTVTAGTAPSLNQAAVGTQTINWSTCQAGSFNVYPTQNTTVGDADFGKITSVTFKVQDATSSKLDNCNYMAYQLGNGTWSSKIALDTATGSGPYTRATADQSITATDALTTINVQFYVS